jgi:superfamily II DNA/RNA helicase
LTFDDFEFEPRLADGLDAMGFTKPTPIQAQAIPIILQDRDLIACAQTGTGKTAAYLLPILHKVLLLPEEQRHLTTLVIAPTRELAVQIDQQVEGLAYFTGISSAPVYGGGSGVTWGQQQKALVEGSDIVVATPGRLIALLQMKSINFSHLKHLVLDEADRMLDMGFYDDILRIIGYLPKQRQTLLFSATMPPKIRKLASTILQEPEQITIAISKPAEGILQQVYLANDPQKLPLLKHILKTGDYGSVIIFSSTKDHVKQLEREITRLGFKAKAFHSDLEQPERDALMRDFKNKQLPILIGTDILSRGIDVDGISLVVNFNAPHDPEDYVHRIGRTARAENTGTAITFINERDQRKFASIERLIGREVAKLPLPEALGLGQGPGYHPDRRPAGGPERGRGGPRGKRPGPKSHEGAAKPPVDAPHAEAGPKPPGTGKKRKRSRGRSGGPKAGNGTPPTE